MINIEFNRSPINGAFVFDSDVISEIDYVSKNLLLLSEPFRKYHSAKNAQEFIIFFWLAVTLPSLLVTSDAFLEEPVRRVINRCVEHGIWSALRSIAEHLQRIDRFRRATNLQANIVNSNTDINYEFWILSIGLLIATLVFGVEFLVWNYFKYIV